MKTLFMFLVLFSMNVIGCGDESEEVTDQSPNLTFGARCTASTECQDALFCYIEEGTNAGICTRTCTAESNCGAAYDVDGYSCYEVSDETGFVCLPR